MKMRLVVLGIYEYIIHAYLVSVHNKVFFFYINVWQKGAPPPPPQVMAINLYIGINALVYDRQLVENVWYMAGQSNTFAIPKLVCP